MREEEFLKPGKLEAFFNRLLGGMVGLGIGPKDTMQLDVVGRRSGRTYSTPVNLLRRDGKLQRKLIAGRVSRRNHRPVSLAE